jgi:Zn-dependent protease with chaperone function
VLRRSTARVLRDRRRHRALVDLVATRNPLLGGTSVLDHDLPVAYCLPGPAPRVVLSRGAVAVLSEDELRAVLAHERAHLDQRHDLVVLPFVALGATFPRLRAVRTARAAVAQLVEVLADDRAAGRTTGRAGRAL